MPSTVSIACIEPGRAVHDLWPKVAPLLKAAIKRTDLSAWRPVSEDILHGKSLLWVCREDERILCAGATSLQKTDSGRVCIITACGGTDMRRWLPLLARIEAYAMAEKCHCLRIFGRIGWMRVLPDYALQSVVLEKELT